MRVGIDIGGTFTDVYAVDDRSGRVVAFKTPSTPQDPSQAVRVGLDRLAEVFGADAALRQLRHGTTVGTNALIQRTGGRVAVITTKGFRDLLEIGRQTRPAIYDLQKDHPAPLAPREMRFEADERVGAKGEVIRPLEDAEIARLVEAARAVEPDAVAIGFLFSFLRDDHERRLADALRAALPGVFVSTSAEVQPEFREYERFSTTTLNAYLQPVVSAYVGRLEAVVAEADAEARLLISQSSGGLMAAETARKVPVRTALSGPAAGVVGAIEAARRSDVRRMITLDVGGTSTDVCFVPGDAPPLAFQRDVAGFPVRSASVDVNAVGAGGGSIVALGADGLLQVGPRSAGADPGPACYGRGGVEPTISDANLIIGRLPTQIAGGDMTLDLDAARSAFAPIAEALALSIEATALGALKVVAANMVRAIRAVSSERGHNPRGATLCPYGGAGGLHAVDVAETLGVTRILAPTAPGLLCARGLLASDLAETFSRTRRTALDGDLTALLGDLAELRSEAAAWAARSAAADEESALTTQTRLEMRYVGQNYELPVDGDDVADDDASRARLAERLAAAHVQAYGHAQADAPAEIVTVRVLARIPGAPPPEPPMRDAGDDAARGRRPVWFDAQGPVETLIIERAGLSPGELLEGPVIIEQSDATTVAPAGWRVRADAAGALILEKIA